MLPPLSNLPLSSKAFFKYVLDDSNEDPQNDGLIRCVKCYVTVHKLCYDISQDIKGTSWLCDRCDKNKLDSVSGKIYYELHELHEFIKKDNFLSNF